MINFLQVEEVSEKHLKEMCEKFKKAKLMIVGRTIKFLKHGEPILLKKMSEKYEVQIYERKKEGKFKKYSILKVKGVSRPWELDENDRT